jgi:hypothetical protein
MAQIVRGPRIWGGERDDEGHRTWHITFVVHTDDPLDGPFSILMTPGLPTTGALWVFGNDVDAWAWCHPQCTVHSSDQPGDPTGTWLVERTFSTKPIKRCQDKSVEDPLLEPQKISGNFVKYQEEAMIDRYGLPLWNTAGERITGPKAEFDANRHTIKIEQNVPDLQLPLISSMKDTVNDSDLWGVPARCVKLSDVSWERKLWGVCTYYFSRSFTFEIRMPQPIYNADATQVIDTIPGWDRAVPDEATKCLRGRWITDIDDSNYGKYLDVNNPDVTNLQDFIRFKDSNGENATCFLGVDEDGNPSGMPAKHIAKPRGGAGTGTDWEPDDVNFIYIEKYDESDFTQLNIPLDFVASS